MNLQSNSQPGNKISACKYLRDLRTSHPRHRVLVASSLKCISSKMFFMSLKGIGISYSPFLFLVFATHTCIHKKIKGWIFQLIRTWPHCLLLTVLHATTVNMKSDWIIVAIVYQKGTTFRRQTSSFSSSCKLCNQQKKKPWWIAQLFVRSSFFVQKLGERDGPHYEKRNLQSGQNW